MAGALEKAGHPKLADRYEVLSEFTYDLAHPNPKFLREKPLALLERDPVGFWRWAVIISLLINMILLYLLI